jgi:hypothetical protein
MGMAFAWRRRRRRWIMLGVELRVFVMPLVSLMRFTGIDLVLSGSLPLETAKFLIGAGEIVLRSCR